VVRQMTKRDFAMQALLEAAQLGRKSPIFFVISATHEIVFPPIPACIFILQQFKSECTSVNKARATRLFVLHSLLLQMKFAPARVILFIFLVRESTFYSSFVKI
jgi:hypothetical protein